jgi:predicted Zn finger-like uncharacterized protein
MNSLDSRFITVCPNCRSKFILTIHQIRQVKEQVVCNKCKKVFSLKNNLKPYTNTANSANTHLKKDVSVQPQPQAQSKINFDNFDINNDNDLPKTSKPPVRRKRKRSTNKNKQKSNLRNILPDYFDLDNYDIDKTQFRDLQDNYFLEEKNTSFLQKFTLSYFLSFLAILMILAQFVSYNFNTLKKDPAWSTILTPFCSLGLCNMETFDATQVTISNIKSRINERDNWMIDALLSNHANYNQPFPLLEMSFKDIKGKVIANIFLPPKQYVKGGLSGETMMPSATSIHIAFEVKPPENQFIAGYSFEIKELEPVDTD